jgi:hypothetical protein
LLHCRIDPVFARLAALPSPRRQWHGVDYKYNVVCFAFGALVVYENHLNHPVADPSTLNKIFTVAAMLWKSMTGAADDRFNLRDYATVPGGVFPVPVVQAKLDLDCQGG